MARNRITEKDYIKAVKKADREREISTHGKIISTRPTKIHNPKNAYNRSQSKKINFDNED